MFYSPNYVTPGLYAPSFGIMMAAPVEHVQLYASPAVAGFPANERIPPPTALPNQHRPYTIPQPGCVPADILAEYTTKLENILFCNPPAALNEVMNGEMACVGQRLYLGSFRHAENGADLVRQGITHVLNCARSCCPNHDESYYTPYPITVQSFEASDVPDFPMLQYNFDVAYDFLENCSKLPSSKCLIHCYQGLNRSTTICVAYMMIKCRLPLLVVVEQVHKNRPFILGNSGFRQQLIEFAYANNLLFETQQMPMIKSPNVLKEPPAVASLPSPRPGAESLQPYVAGPYGAVPRPVREPSGQVDCGYGNLRDAPPVVERRKRGQLRRMMSTFSQKLGYDSTKSK